MEKQLLTHTLQTHPKPLQCEHTLGQCLTCDCNWNWNDPFLVICPWIDLSVFLRRPSYPDCPTARKIQKPDLSFAENEKVLNANTTNDQQQVMSTIAGNQNLRITQKNQKRVASTNLIWRRSPSTIFLLFFLVWEDVHNFLKRLSSKKRTQFSSDSF